MRIIAIPRVITIDTKANRKSTVWGIMDVIVGFLEIFAIIFIVTYIIVDR
jgi:hypothetical protein